MESPKITSKDVFRYILVCIKPFKSSIFIICICATIWALELSLIPYLMKHIINGVSAYSQDNFFDIIKIPVFAYMVYQICAAFYWRIYDYGVNIKMTPQLRVNIATSSFQYLMGQSHQYYQHHFSGSLTNRLNDLLNHVIQIVTLVFDQFLSRILAFTFAIFTLWQINFKFALGLIVWVVFFLSSTSFLVKRVHKFSNIFSALSSTLTGKIVDVITNMMSVRLFARKKYEQETLDKTLIPYKEAEKNLSWTYLWIWGIYGISFAVFQGFNFYFLIKGRREGVISVGDFVLVLTIVNSIVAFLWQLTHSVVDFVSHLGKVTQALTSFTYPSIIVDKDTAVPLEIKKGSISFENVTFSYLKSSAIFNNLSLIIPGGQKVGLVGYSGSGKSTFVNLILRLFDIEKGNILIDGQSIQDITQDSLHENIGLIPQDPTLFHRTIKDNIHYGLPTASDHNVITAAQQAHAHDFIIKTSEGYETMVGERGIKLSGGQRQRIAIARAILKNAPILILDEATSQLDSVTEIKIQETLWELMQRKTTLIIAHRLSTLQSMDRILVFDKGKIVEDGSHQDLLAQGGLYKKLWETQVGGFLIETDPL